MVEAFPSTWSKNSHTIKPFKINNLFVKQKRNMGARRKSRPIAGRLLTLCTSCGMERPGERQDGVQAGCRDYLRGRTRWVSFPAMKESN
ncbi:MAG: hypothetical protein J0H45_00820 [Stenotrophomonas nitritireducens]|uniref:Uncharacterized protein n=1 Tax=Stenotrophomonas nitritireducens TaxID=83617 RepID=A0A9D8PYW8_9GAMM|nr:hypothetical protein [Stenotrophomonas nitritireducens]